MLLNLVDESGAQMINLGYTCIMCNSLKEFAFNLGNAVGKHYDIIKTYMRLLRVM